MRQKQWGSMYGGVWRKLCQKILQVQEMFLECMLQTQTKGSGRGLDLNSWPPLYAIPTFCPLNKAKKSPEKYLWIKQNLMFWGRIKDKISAQKHLKRAPLGAGEMLLAHPQASVISMFQQCLWSLITPTDRAGIQKFCTPNSSTGNHERLYQILCQSIQ